MQRIKNIAVVTLMAVASMVAAQAEAQTIRNNAPAAYYSSAGNGALDVAALDRLLEQNTAIDYRRLAAPQAVIPQYIAPQTAYPYPVAAVQPVVVPVQVPAQPVIYYQQGW